MVCMKAPLEWQIKTAIVSRPPPPDMETNPLQEEQRDLQEGSTLIPIWRGQLRLLSVVGR